jgi:dTDP-4-dehydrorhamnose 3,5-epimerase
VKYIDTEIPDVKILEPSVFGDERGFFMETFRLDEFTKNCSAKPFVQDNHSKSSHGILRGLHYQLKNTQGKLVRVTAGEVYDIAVDMRKTSPTFGQHVGVILSGENKKQLWVPEGFAHGFYVMSESAEFVYKCTDYYAPEHEISLAWNDANLAINWPLTNNQGPTLSVKDKNALAFNEAPKLA